MEHLVRKAMQPIKLQLEPPARALLLFCLNRRAQWLLGTAQYLIRLHRAELRGRLAHTMEM